MEKQKEREKEDTGSKNVCPNYRKSEIDLKKGTVMNLREKLKDIVLLISVPTIFWVLIIGLWETISYPMFSDTTLYLLVCIIIPIISGFTYSLKSKKKTGRRLFNSALSGWSTLLPFITSVMILIASRASNIASDEILSGLIEGILNQPTLIIGFVASMIFGLVGGYIGSKLRDE
jgi:hypothetical protein